MLTTLHDLPYILPSVFLSMINTTSRLQGRAEVSLPVQSFRLPFTLLSRIMHRWRSIRTFGSVLERQKVRHRPPTASVDCTCTLFVAARRSELVVLSFHGSSGYVMGETLPAYRRHQRKNGSLIKRMRKQCVLGVLFPLPLWTPGYEATSLCAPKTHLWIADAITTMPNPNPKKKLHTK